MLAIIAGSNCKPPSDPLPVFLDTPEAAWQFFRDKRDGRRSR